MNDLYTKLSPRELDDVCRQEPSLLVIDVLPPESHAACRIPAASNASVHEMAFAGKVAEIAPDHEQALVIYGSCDTSRDAEVAAEKLNRLGYHNLRILAGGLEAWHAAGLPVDGEQAAPAPPESVPEIADGRYPVRAEESRILWIGRNANGPHDGSVAVAGGEIVVDGGQINGRVEIDMRQIENFDLAGNEWQGALLEHLASDDFFFTERFAEAVFNIDAARPLPEATPAAPTHEVSGRLALRGVEAPLTFPATLSRIGNDRLAVEAHFDWDRTRWGVIYGSSRFFARLGMHMVFDPISIQLRLVL